MFSWLKNIFRTSKKINKEKSNVIQSINIGNINIFDDVWIKVNNNIYPGWVFDKIGNNVHIVYFDNNCILDAKFKIERPLDRIEITQNNKTLILKRYDV